MPEELTQAQLGARLGVSRQRVGQLYAAGRLSHQPRKLKFGRNKYLLLFPRETRVLPGLKTGRPRKDLTAGK